MSNKKTHLKFWQLFAGIITLSYSLTVFADYEPYPGKHQARLISVDSASSITVNIETWPGYARTIYITLPDLILPGNTMQPPACELELAQKALIFTHDFVTLAKKIIINNLRMNTSADEYGTAGVYTEKGSLGAALKKEGLARSSSIDPETPWCK